MRNLLLDGVHSKRLIFRLPKTGHQEEWLPFFEDPNLDSSWLGDNLNPEQACQKYFERIQERSSNNLGGLNALTLKSTAELVGFAGLLVQEVDGIEELEIGYSLLPKFRGKGLATEAAQCCKQVAIYRKLAASLISIIQVANDASIKVANRNEMTLEKQTLFKNQEVFIFRFKSKSHQD